LEIKKLKGAISAILFSSGDPISLDRIAEVLEMDKPTVFKILENMIDEFNVEGFGIRIVKLEENYQMCSAPQYADYVRKILDIRRNTPLSQAGMEVLAIVAYNQPVTKSFIEQIRGVDCSGVLGSLTTKGLIEERGRLELPGRPLLYGTTSNFLRCLHISSLSELPPLPEKQPMDGDNDETEVSITQAG
jgi:segregation and condensation protein B